MYPVNHEYRAGNPRVILLHDDLNLWAHHPWSLLAYNTE